VEYNYAPIGWPLSLAPLCFALIQLSACGNAAEPKPSAETLNRFFNKLEAQQKAENAAAIAVDRADERGRAEAAERRIKSTDE
jgi:hypothetical protein